MPSQFGPSTHAAANATAKPTASTETPLTTDVSHRISRISFCTAFHIGAHAHYLLEKVRGNLVVVGTREPSGQLTR